LLEGLALSEYNGGTDGNSEIVPNSARPFLLANFSKFKARPRRVKVYRA
jgi:hypothetical protein